MLDSMQVNTVNTGPNIINNGRFDSDLSGWNAGNNFAWSAGTAAYQWTEGCYIGQIEQTINLTSGKRYKLRFKYKATNPFNIHVRMHDFDTDAEIITDQIISAADNGNWHMVTIFINATYDVTAILHFYCYSLIDGVEDACAEAGNSESGFFLDDVSLYEQSKTYACGSCDEVIMDFNRPLEFQVKLDASAIVNEAAITGNPYDAITTTTLEFDILTSPIGNQFQLYIGSKIYQFEWSITTDPNYEYTVDGNLYKIRVNIDSDLAMKLNLRQAINDIIDANSGTTSSRSGSTITMLNVPAGSYLNNWLYVDNIDTVTPSTNIGKSFYYENGYLCYYEANNNERSFQITNNLTAGGHYRFSFELNSSFTDFSGTVTIDDGTNPVQSFPVAIPYGLNTITVDFDALLTVAHDIKFTLTDTNQHNTGLCMTVSSISLISLSTSDFIDKIETLDCQDNTTEIPFSAIISGSNMLIQINNSDFPISTPFQIIVTDADGNVFVSQKIRLIDFDTYAWCKRSKLMKLTWTDNCKFGDIDYLNLPFVNELYIRGFLQKAALDKKDRIQSVNANTGAGKTIYNRSVAKVEIRTALYAQATHAMLERAFEHGTVTVDDKSYYLDDSGNYTINPIGNGYFNARLDLVESGGEVIKSDCCC